MCSAPRSVAKSDYRSNKSYFLRQAVPPGTWNYAAALFSVILAVARGIREFLVNVCFATIVVAISARTIMTRDFHCFWGMRFLQLSTNPRFLVFATVVDAIISTHHPNPAIFSVLGAFFHIILQIFPQYFHNIYSCGK